MLGSQLKMCKGISYAAVAAHADKSGRRKLAAMLVEHEPRSSKQVELGLPPLLVSFLYGADHLFFFTCLKSYVA